MDITIIIDAVRDYGYFALFFFLWLGIVGAPIPDEAVVMSGGFVTSLGLLNTTGALLVTYAGVVSGLSIGYVLGRLLGKPALEFLSRKKKFEPYIRKANDLIETYGKAALIVSYFIPIVRHIVPYLVGINKMSYGHYALYSYSTGFFWTLLLFLTGKLFGQHIMLISNWMQDYRILFTLMFGCLLLIGIIAKKSKKTLKDS